jgi:hypothetical protein
LFLDEEATSVDKFQNVTIDQAFERRCVRHRSIRNVKNKTLTKTIMMKNAAKYDVLAIHMLTNL